MFCSECGGGLVKDERHGELVCSKCGEVVRFPDASLEGLPIEQPHELPMRNEAHAPLGSYVGFDRDGKGHRLAARSKLAASRLQKTQAIQTHRGNVGHQRRRNAILAFQRIAAELNLPAWVVGDATVLHTRVYGHPCVIFPSLRFLAAALMVTAMRNGNLSVPLRETADRLDLDFARLAWTLKRLRKYLPQALAPLSIPAVAHDYAARLGHPELGNAAAGEAQALPLTNQNPLLAGAAAAYRVLKRNGVKTGAKRIAKSTGLSAGALRTLLRRWRQAETATP